MEEQPPEPNTESPAEEPRDVLAAEAFAVGAGDPGLHHEPAHDVLAADEFPLPAPEPHAVPPDWQPPAPSPRSAMPGSESAVVPFAARVRRIAPFALLALVALLVLRRRRGR